MLKQAINWGVTYWDTAHSYGGGRSEKGIGKYFAKYPQDRQKIFLVTKSGAWSIKGMTRELDESLERMKTDYVDLFFVHAISSISEMDADTRAWADKAKAAGAEIVSFHKDAKVDATMVMDNMDLSTVKTFAEQFNKKYDRLDFLLNNAGIMAQPLVQSKDGYDIQFQVRVDALQMSMEISTFFISVALLTHQYLLFLDQPFGPLFAHSTTLGQNEAN